MMGILSGTSAGGLGAILHCVKCISLMLVSLLMRIGQEPTTLLHILELRPKFVLLPSVCGTTYLHATFIINSAYDSWQINNILVPEGVADPEHVRDTCKKDINKCSPSQIQTLQDFRSTFLEALNELGPSFHFHFLPFPPWH
ncbi:pectin acetylesterase 8-like [Nicotiana tabacum]|uniref:Pectin acetylesterase 8-like n=1 Tax=Nicotiana tabacum TaxID=4097 RepID=A0AC58SSG1_TOBAC